jgi:hypothetical protein
MKEKVMKDEILIELGEVSEETKGPLGGTVEGAKFDERPIG